MTGTNDCLFNSSVHVYIHNDSWTHHTPTAHMYKLCTHRALKGGYKGCMHYRGSTVHSGKETVWRNFSSQWCHTKMANGVNDHTCTLELLKHSDSASETMLLILNRSTKWFIILCTLDPGMGVRTNTMTPLTYGPGSSATICASNCAEQ